MDSWKICLQISWLFEKIPYALNISFHCVQTTHFIIYRNQNRCLGASLRVLDILSKYQNSLTCSFCDLLSVLRFISFVFLILYPYMAVLHALPHVLCASFPNYLRFVHFKSHERIYIYNYNCLNFDCPDGFFFSCLISEKITILIKCVNIVYFYLHLILCVFIIN